MPRLTTRAKRAVQQKRAASGTTTAFTRSVSPFLPICTLFIVRSIIQVERNVLPDAITPPLPEPANDVYVATPRRGRASGKQAWEADR